MNFREWAIQQHKNMNQLYDGYLPYEFHLRMVNGVHLQFEDIALTLFEKNQGEDDVITNACYGHDLVEDTGVTYNNIVSELIGFTREHALSVAEIIRACTSDVRGRNRKERMSDAVYSDIINTPGALFVKLCDRIANVRYGVWHGGNMLSKYRQEYIEFKKKLYRDEYERMFHCLEALLIDHHAPSVTIR